MKRATYPVAINDELLSELRKIARETGLSMADAMRQSITLGLPTLRQRLAPARLSIKELKPFTKAEAKKAFATNREWDKLESVMAQRPAVHSTED